MRYGHNIQVEISWVFQGNFTKVVIELRLVEAVSVTVSQAIAMYCGGYYWNTSNLLYYV